MAKKKSEIKKLQQKELRSLRAGSRPAVRLTRLGLALRRQQSSRPADLVEQVGLTAKNA